MPGVQALPLAQLPVRKVTDNNIQRRRERLCISESLTSIEHHVIFSGIGVQIKFKARKEKTMKISARNQFKGTIVSIEEGAVNGIVKIDIGGNVVTSTISMGSIRELGLKVGGTAYAVVKATSVMVAVDD